MVTRNSCLDKQWCLSAAIGVVLVGAAASVSAADSIELISVGPDGPADDTSGGGAISSSGRFVAFDSWASNLVAGDNNGWRDVFVRDRISATTERVSLGLGGVEGNSASGDADISGDGRFVAFVSYASNLVPGDTNRFTDVFVRDRQTGTTERVSIGSGGVQGNGDSGNAQISADGRFVAFHSGATNLVPRDTNEADDIFVRDRQQATTRRVSVGPNGRQSNGPSSSPKISAKGHFVAFESDANNLVRGENEDLTDIYLRARPTRSTLLVTPPSDDDYDYVSLEDLSAYGKFVVFNTVQMSEPLDYSEVFVRTLEP